ncbi:MAG TPA: MerR family transcriptional regulator, partial [Solirubrobacterales bacterium]|nr:MerR family transcriptional regulator [Solirubrobacterales bacterium]
MDEKKLKIGEVAKRAGLRKSAIRYYESIGLLAEPERTSGQRLYDESVLRRLSVIEIAQRAGLSLDEIRELLEVGNEPTSRRLREIATTKLPEIEALISRAEAMRQWLRAAEGCSCEAIDDCALFDPDHVESAKGLGAAIARRR